MGQPIVVLIEVPQIKVKVLPPRVPGPEKVRWGRLDAGWPAVGRVRRRRRLRREVRVGGTALLTLAALAGVCALGGSGRGYQRLALPDLSTVARAAQGEGMRSLDRQKGSGGTDDDAIPTPSVAVLAIEPATPVAPRVDPVVPVVLPGYVLPDDSLEEPAHEGG